MVLTRFGNINYQKYFNTVEVDPETLDNPAAGTVYEGVFNSLRWIKDPAGVITYDQTGYAHLKWLNLWTAGEYQAYDTVRDGAWAMVANKITSDRPAPQPSGEPYYLYTGTLTDTSIIAKQVIAGQRITTGASGGYLNAYRIYTKTSQVYEIFLVTNPLAVPIFDLIALFTATTDGWQTFNINPILVQPGVVFDILAKIQETSSTPVEWSASWDYQTPQNAVDAPTGTMQQARSSADIIYISKTDSNSVDRSTELGALTTGDKIRTAGQQWVIQDVIDGGTYYTFTVIPAQLGTPEGVQTVTFEIVTATPIDYGVDTNFWSTNPNVQGLFIADGKWADIVPDENQYIMDIQIQNANVSDDWDLISTMGEGSSGGGIYDAGFTAIGLVIDGAGDDKGMSITEGQLSTGNRGAGREVAFGEGDSYPVDTAYHTDLGDITGLVVSNATDVTDILQSDSGSTTGFFGGVTAGKILLVGSEYPFTGLKVKYAALSTLGFDGIISEYLRDNSPTWQEIGFMSAEADWKYEQFGNRIGNKQNASEHIRFGYKDPKIVPDVWDKVTLTINGTQVTKYWGRMRIGTAIGSDPTIEQVKQHTNHWECNKDGVTEYFGLSRPPFSLNLGMFENADYSPLDANIAIATNITVVATGNELANGKIDGTIIIGKIPIGMDTSIPVELIVNWYQTGTTSGDVELEVESVNILPDFVYNGTAQKQSSTPVVTSLIAEQYKTKTSSFLINVETLLPGDKLVASLYRDASAGNPDDTLVGNIVIAHSEMIGYSWR